MRRDDLYLADIVESAGRVAEFLAGFERDSFLGSDLVRSAVLQKLIIIGEAAARISVDLKDRYQDIDWQGVISFRNFLVHQYFAVDWEIVWVAATKELPPLADQVAAILDAE